MVGRTPVSTLFPYTTLFRSRGERADHRGAARAQDTGLLASDGLERRPEEALVIVRDADDGRHHRLADVRRDRKSTRLNSSHSQISYAVFCLKKKNTHAQSQP